MLLLYNVIIINMNNTQQVNVIIIKMNNTQQVNVIIINMNNTQTSQCNYYQHE